MNRSSEKHFARCPLFFVFVILALVTFTGCQKSGLTELIAGPMEGPSRIRAGDSAQFTIASKGGKNTSYTWYAEPGIVVSLESDEGTEVTLNTSDTMVDVRGKIWVVINSDTQGPIIVEKVIIIEASVAQGIEGPPAVEENSAASYSVVANLLGDIDYEWECEPEDAGSFDTPDQAETVFRANLVHNDLQVVIRVTMHHQGSAYTRELGIIIEDGYTWAKWWGTGVTNPMANIALDSVGSVYMAGYFAYAQDFDFSDAEDIHDTGSSDTGIFLTKRDDKGHYLWTQTLLPVVDFDHHSHAKALSIFIDDNDDIYITGYYTGAIDFDPGPGEDIRESYHYEPYTYFWYKNAHFVTRFSSDGDLELAVTFGDSIGIERYSVGYDVAADRWGNIYICGGFLGPIDFDPGPGFDIRHSGLDTSEEYTQDSFLLKLDANGEYLWANTWGGPKNFSYDVERMDVAAAVAADPWGNPIVTGNFNSSVDFDPSDEEMILTSKSNTDAYTVSYDDDDGSLRWVKQMSWPGIGEYFDPISGGDVAIDPMGNAYVLYVDIHLLHAGPVVEKIDPSGGTVWSIAMENLLRPYFSALTLDVSGGCYVTGKSQLTGNYADAPLTLVKLDADGEPVYDMRWLQDEYATGIRTDVAVSGPGDIYICGTFEGYANFDPIYPDDEYVAHALHGPKTFLLKTKGE